MAISASNGLPASHGATASTPPAPITSCIKHKQLDEQVINRIVELGRSDVQQAYAEAQKLANNRLFSHLHTDLVTNLLPALYGSSTATSDALQHPPSSSSKPVPAVPSSPPPIKQESSQQGTSAPSSRKRTRSTTQAIYVSDSDTEDELPADKAEEEHQPAQRQKTYVKWSVEDDAVIEQIIDEHPNYSRKQLADLFESRQAELVASKRLSADQAHTSAAILQHVGVVDRQLGDWTCNELDYLQRLVTKKPTFSNNQIANHVDQRQVSLVQAGTLSKNRMLISIVEQLRRLRKRINKTQ